MKIHRLNSQGTLAVVIPKDIAKRFQWKEGDEVIFNITEDTAALLLINLTVKELENK